MSANTHKAELSCTASPAIAHHVSRDPQGATDVQTQLFRCVKNPTICPTLSVHRWPQSPRHPWPFHLTPFCSSLFQRILIYRNTCCFARCMNLKRKFCEEPKDKPVPTVTLYKRFHSLILWFSVCTSTRYWSHRSRNFAIVFPLFDSTSSA